MRTTMRFIGSSLALLVIVLLAAPAQAGQRPALPPGMGEYVMVLWPAGSPAPDGKGTIKNVPEPDIPKLGGKVLGTDANVRLIQLPLQAAAALRRHDAVVFLQRVWMGESLEGWNEAYTVPPSATTSSSTARLKAGVNGDTNLTWGPKDYVYDTSGNIKSIGTDNYTYDSAGRLIQSTVDGKTESYAYDSFGNLTQKGVAGANPVDIPVDGASNRLLGVTYDAAGNAATGDDGRRAYKYDSLNMLTRVKPSTLSNERRMLYDSNEERIGMLVVNDSLSRWTIRDFEGRIVREYKASSLAAWTWEQDSFYGEKALVGGETQQWSYTGDYQYGGRRHYHLDHLGSVRMVTDDGRPGRSLSEHDYYPFGSTITRTYQEQYNPADPHIDAMRFAGHWRDFLGALNADNTDYVDYMHARYYDPNLGRFLSVDPAKKSVDVRIPQSWNRYSYALNKPVLYTDPDGRCVSVLPCPAWLIAGTETAATQVGTRAAAGSVAGPIGVALAGAAVTGWQIGRGIGTSTIGGRTIDSRVTDLFVKGIELGISLSENTKHGKDRENDPNRQVDVEKVKANGDQFIDTETGARVFVLGSKVVLIGEDGKMSQWNDQTKRETNKKIRDGKWSRIPKDANDHEIE